MRFRDKMSELLQQVTKLVVTKLVVDAVISVAFPIVIARFSTPEGSGLVRKMAIAMCVGQLFKIVYEILMYLFERRRTARDKSESYQQMRNLQTRIDTMQTTIDTMQTTINNLRTGQSNLDQGQSNLVIRFDRSESNAVQGQSNVAQRLSNLDQGLSNVVHSQSNVIVLTQGYTDIRDEIRASIQDLRAVVYAGQSNTYHGLSNMIAQGRNMHGGGNL